MNSRSLLLWTAALVVACSGISSQPAPVDARFDQLSASVKTLGLEVDALRTEVRTVRLEASTARASQMQEELRSLVAERHSLEEQDLARQQELAETDDYLDTAKPRGEQREAADQTRYELAVTRSSELSRQRAQLDQRETELRGRLAHEQRQRQSLLSQ
ncbi:MAG: hypothetical protein ABI693_03080 [Bryobacteraceae bacterium]